MWHCSLPSQPDAMELGWPQMVSCLRSRSVSAFPVSLVTVRTRRHPTAVAGLSFQQMVFLILMVKFFSINGKTSMFHGLAWLNHTLSVYLCDGWTSNFNKNMSQFVLWSNLQSSKVSCVLLPPLLATDLGTLGNHGKRGWVKLETGLRRIWDVWWMVLVALCFSHDS
jgi:hypothetical protein